MPPLSVIFAGKEFAMPCLVPPKYDANSVAKGLDKSVAALRANGETKTMQRSGSGGQNHVVDQLSG